MMGEGDFDFFGEFLGITPKTSMYLNIYFKYIKFQKAYRKFIQEQNCKSKH